MEKFIKNFLAESAWISSNLDIKKIGLMVRQIKICKKNKGRIFFLGVGGSAGNASHAVNDFRKIALLRDPTKSASAVTANTARLTKAINIATSPTPGTFTPDEEINQASTGATGKVVEWDATNKILYYIQTRHNNAGVDATGNLTAFSGANVITGQGGGSPTGTPAATTGTVSNVSFTSGYSVPEIDHDSGDVLYIENRTPIQRAPDQTENIKLVIEF